MGEVIRVDEIKHIGPPLSVIEGGKPDGMEVALSDGVTKIIVRELSLPEVKKYASQIACLTKNIVLWSPEEINGFEEILRDVLPPNPALEAVLPLINNTVVVKIFAALAGIKPQ